MKAACILILSALTLSGCQTQASHDLGTDFEDGKAVTYVTLEEYEKMTPEQRALLAPLSIGKAPASQSSPTLKELDKASTTTKEQQAK